MNLSELHIRNLCDGDERAVVAPKVYRNRNQRSTLLDRLS